jgi:hypothetical protein
MDKMLAVRGQARKATVSKRSPPITFEGKRLIFTKN